MVKNISIVGLAVVLLVAGFFLFTAKDENEVVKGGSTFSPCEVTTTTAVSVGPSNSKTILSAKSGRSWARIQQPVNASNTVTISLGSTATLGNGLELAEATTTPASVFYLDFGMETDLPYTGEVTGITGGSATTSVLVTECR